MRSSILAFASVAVLASRTAAQSGYGRFPCTIVNGDGTFSPDQTQCTAANLVAPGAGDGSGAQGDGVTPTGAPQCQLETESGAYFCGIAGAACTSADDCDNGGCALASGTCQGGFTQSCSGTDSNCSGYLYCLSNDFSVTPNDSCGGLGAFCQDAVSVDPTLSVEAAQLIFNQFCSSGYCSSTAGNCAVLSNLGETCADDPEFACNTGLVCDQTSFTCVTAPVVSARARERRAAHAKKSLCPASHSACSVEGARGFECVDTSSNLEQCGACASSGGVDCTAIEGVASVGCIAGQCEIWACAEGFSWDSASQSCTN